MEEEKIKFDTAVLAKEKGFKIPGYHLLDIEKETEESYLYELPSQSLVQKWLREEHKIYVDVRWYCDFDDEEELKKLPEDILFRAEIMNCSNRTIGYKTCYDKRILNRKSHEEALEKGLVIGLKMI